MNHFGGLALHFLSTHKGRDGVLVKSVATSNFGNAVAQGLGIGVRETPVGFKNFRPYMLAGASEKALVCYEESDGISAYGNTLEKDATFGLLLALEMMTATGQNLGDYLNQVEEEFGRFHPDRSGIEVSRGAAGPELRRRLRVLEEWCAPGTQVLVGDRTRTVTERIDIDGTKVVLDDGSWFLIRPSGTEPKVRFYVESRRPDETRLLVSIAERLTEKAVTA